MSNDDDIPPALAKVLTVGPYLVGAGVFFLTSLVGVIAMWIAGNDGARWLPWVIGLVAGAIAVSKARAAIAEKMIGLRALQEQLAAVAARSVGGVDRSVERGVVDVNVAVNSGSPRPKTAVLGDVVTIDMPPADSASGDASGEKGRDP